MSSFLFLTAKQFTDPNATKMYYKYWQVVHNTVD